MSSRALDAVLPDVRVAQAELPEACEILTARLAPDYDGDPALDELAALVATRAREVHDAIVVAERAKIDPRARLALERVIDAHTPDLDAARGLYDLLLGSVGEAAQEVDLPGVLEEALAPSSSRGPQAREAVTVDLARRVAAPVLARPAVGVALVLLAIASVRTAGVRLPHVQLSGGGRSVTVGASEGAGDHVLVAAPRLVAPTAAVARLAARRAGFELDLGPAARVGFPSLSGRARRDASRRLAWYGAAMASSAHLVPSRRGRPGNDPIFTLSKLASDAKARGEDVVNGTLGALFDDAGKLCTLPSLTEALLSSAPEQLASYAPIAGPPAFLAAVKRDVTQAAPALASRAVAVATPGGTGALRHAFASFVEDGHALLTTSFYWSPYQTIAAEHGRKVATFSMFAADGSLDTAALDRALGELMQAQGRALVVLNDPCHNPTGYSMSEDDWARTAEVLAKHGASGPLTVLLDIAYAAFAEGSLSRPVSALARIADKVMIAFAWSASKSFLAYGQRVGALVAIPPSADDVADLDAGLTYACRGTWSNCNHAGMAAVARLLDEGGRAAKERKVFTDLLATRVDAWNKAARPLGLQFPRYDGGFFVTVESKDPPGDAAKLREVGVYVVPLAVSLRVALCSVPTAQVPRVAAAMAKVLLG
ncbi:MAG: aminotransferase class I/II-fold pyridoxal phosphate-dependent enzyme [Polyangiaceae bacterium]|nr:aminotransferase class I/II-fold pyridoxal phosphate-dependent enzyme [Polyangiaceae bacterium]